MDLWHAVLDDAARNSQRSTPSKTLLVLGALLLVKRLAAQCDRLTRCYGDLAGR